MKPNSIPQRPKRGLSLSKTPAPKKLRGESVYDIPDRVLQNETSPLYKDATNVKEILQHPLAVNAIGSQFYNIGPDDFTSAVATFKEDGREGRHDQEWLREAIAAKKMRQGGEFDEYHQARFKSHWAEGSSELADNEGGKSSGPGCRDGTEEKSRRDDDEGAGGSGGSGRGQMTSSGFGHSSVTDGARYKQNKGFGQDAHYGQSSTYTQNSKTGHDYDYGKAPEHYSSCSTLPTFSYPEDCSSYKPLPGFPSTVNDTHIADQTLITSHVHSLSSAQGSTYNQEQISVHHTDFFPNSSNVQIRESATVPMKVFIPPIQSQAQGRVPIVPSYRVLPSSGFIPAQVTGLYDVTGRTFYRADQIQNLPHPPFYVPGWHYDWPFAIDPALKHIRPVGYRVFINAQKEKEIIEIWSVYGAIVVGRFDAQNFLYGIPCRNLHTQSV